MSAEFAKTITEADILLFGAATGDNQALHFDEEYAAKTQFKGRIAHGILSAGVISAALGNRLPGPGAVYVAQTLRFKAPVRAGDTLHAKVTIKELLPEKKRVVLDTVASVKDTTVLVGEATMMVPGKADTEALS
ncbi:MAG: (R)-hydratase [Candidatus Methylumidiphilus alinenensis]|uniref:(R)-hydratase n=1 Tax=Candidatus Methylumidiphilus alinenensis TaxID=2202197 RepID=A0A2W4QTL0_9GAMM|nr:MAG: (R)-hydratase [Candidatus Methylumidiphilus alinenensis]